MAHASPQPSRQRRSSPYPPPSSPPPESGSGAGTKLAVIGAVVLFLVGLAVGAVLWAGDEPPAPVAAAITPTESVTVTESATVTAEPTVTVTATRSPSGTPTPAPSPAPSGRPAQEADDRDDRRDDDERLRNADPGERCSPEGAQGVYRGRLYTCEGPGELRWRR
jgi:hypothetical protein